MTDDEFNDLNEEAMEAPKAPKEEAKPVAKKTTARKAATKKKVAAKVPEVGEGAIVILDIQFANAVKVGIHQKNYFSNEKFDMTMRGIVIELRVIGAPAGTPSVFTTLYNVIHWRVL